MDTMEATKIVAGLCGALLVFLLVGWGAETLYHVGSGGHGDAHAAYEIEVEETETASEEAGPTITELLASADAAKGAKVFNKCKACHKLEDGANSTGPHLFSVVDRAVGGIDGFGYSGGMAALGGTWSVEILDQFLAKPKSLISDTKMSFAGLKKPTDRANLIAYLQSIGQ